jgi:hypothetical protein
MTQPGHAPSPPNESWNVNMPAIIGVVFVFLVGVIVWVVVSGGGGDQSTSPASSTSAVSLPPPTSLLSETSPPLTTSPQPLPSLPDGSSSTIATSTTLAGANITVAPGGDPSAVPGDLAISGRPMQRPDCDGAFITILASAIGGQASAGGIENVLSRFPGSNYLRTDQTCGSLTPARAGEPIYVVYLGPFVVDSDACSARSQGPEGAYARQLSNQVGPDHFVSCA